MTTILKFIKSLLLVCLTLCTTVLYAGSICDGTITMTNETDLGNGQWRYEFNVCPNINHAGVATDNMNISFFPLSINILSFEVDGNAGNAGDVVTFTPNGNDWEAFVDDTYGNHSFTFENTEMFPSTSSDFCVIVTIVTDAQMDKVFGTTTDYGMDWTCSNPFAIDENGYVCKSFDCADNDGAIGDNTNNPEDPVCEICTASDSKCDEGSGYATFDLTALSDDVACDSAAVYTVQWYRNPSLNEEITGAELTAYNTQTGSVYAKITSNNTGCTNSTEVVLMVTQGLSLTDSEIFACGSSNGTFDLTESYDLLSPNNGGTVTFTFYTDAGRTNQITGDLSNYNSGETTIYVSAQDQNACTGEGELTLTLNSLTLQTASDSKCGANGEATFDLTDYHSNLFPTYTNGDQVQYYTDPARTNEISGADLTAYQTSGGTVYVKVTTANGCEGETELTLSVTDVTANSIAYPVCETVAGAGEGQFNLDAIEASVSNGGVLTWWEDNTTQFNPISNTVSYVSTTTDIYALVGDPGCQVVATISLVVNETPETSDTALLACDDGTSTATFDLSALEAYVSNNASDVTVEWFESSNVQDNPINGGDETAYLTATRTVYAKVTSNSGSGCYSIANVDLTVSPISASSTALDACSDGGVGTFDLTAANLNTAGNDYLIEWYTSNDLDPANLIDPADAYVSVATTVYAHVQDTSMNPTCEKIVDVELRIDGLMANDTTLEVCAEQTKYGLSTIVDLSDYESAVSASANQIVWYSDAVTTTEIDDPSLYEINVAATVYAKVTGGQNGCEDVAEVIFNLIQAPEFNTAAIDACGDDDGLAIFDLQSYEGQISDNASDLSGTWYSDASFQNEITAVNAYESATSTLYLTFVDTVTGCSNEGAITANVIVVDVQNSSFTACDDGSGTAEFDLTVNAMTNDLSAQVTWYSVASFDGVSLISNINAYEAADGDIAYALVTETTSGLGCSDTAFGLLSIGEITANDASIHGCRNDLGFASFDLSTLDAAIGGGFPVTYFPTINDADNETNQIDQNATFYSDASRVYAIVTQGDDCKSDAAVVTLVRHSPEAITTTIAQECEDEAGNAIFDLASISTGNGVTTWYPLFDLDPTSVFTVAQMDAYTVDGTTSLSVVLTDQNLCADTGIFNLVVSPLPNIDSVGFTACDVNGDGSEAYQLTSLNDTIGGGLLVNWFTDAEYATPVFNEENFVGGNEHVYATVTSDDGCVRSTPIYLTLNSEQATLNAVSANCVNDRTEFEFEYTGIYDSVRWYFSEDDSLTANEDTASFHYIKKRVETVQLKVYEGICAFEANVEFEVKGEFEVSAFGETTIFLGQSTTLSTDQGGDTHFWTGDNNIDNVNSPEPEVSPDETTIYYVTVTNDFGCQDNDSVKVVVNEGKDFLIPDSFTPNGDGLNDHFNIPNEGICSIDMVIYNRWGRVVAQVTDPNMGWDGKDMNTGKNQPIDGYAYSLVINYCDGTTSSDDGEPPITGMVHILR